jgi:hypothetical protein
MESESLFNEYIVNETRPRLSQIQESHEFFVYLLFQFSFKFGIIAFYRIFWLFLFLPTSWPCGVWLVASHLELCKYI